MSNAGRPPKPTRLKVLQGNPGRRPLNQSEPQFAADNLTCPGWLTSAARREWRRIVKAMPDGLATEGDRAALASYCQAWARWQEAERALSEAGSLTFEEPVLDKKGELVGHKIKPRPEVAIAQRYAHLMLAAAGKFGFDPSSRTKVRLPEKPKEDDLTNFLNRGKAANG